MILRIHLVLLAIISLALAGKAAQPDRRLMPIQPRELQKSVRQLPLNSSEHVVLLSRARSSNLEKLAYHEYTTVWKTKPQDANANLFRGMSALMFWRSGLFSPKPTRRDTTVFQVARSCLQKAVTLRPRSSLANMEYGFFLWQFGNDMPNGLSLLNKAVLIAPEDARSHIYLGLVYSNPSGNAYDMQKAEKEVQMAIRLDPTYAFPHDLLSGIYTRLGRKSEAQIESQKYQSLLPAPRKS